MNRAPLPRARFWWVTLVAMVVLSLGANCQVGLEKYDLPANWLWQVFPPFRLLRVPARFNLFASLGAAVLAAAGLKHALGRINRPALRAAVYLAACVVAVADLAMVPFKTEPVPPLPGCYAWIHARNPRAAILELPLLESSSENPLNALCGYWQSVHRMRTTAGYSAHPNMPFDTQIVHNTPFDAYTIIKPDYLLQPDDAAFGIASHVQFRDYVWLHLTINRLDYVVVHHEAQLMPEVWKHLDRLQAQLHDARVYEDEATTVYDRALLQPPQSPTLLHAGGWRSAGWPEHLAFTLGKSGDVVVYNPRADEPLVFTLDASAFRAARGVSLYAGEQELARWHVEPDQPRTYASPPFRLACGVQALTLRCDGDEPPAHQHEAAGEGDMRPFSLRVVGISLLQASETGDGARQLARRPRPVR